MDTITKKNFKSLTKTEQVVMVINSGKELLTRQNNDNYIKLYLIPNMFVEILYELNKTTIVRIDTPTIEKLILNYNINKDQLSQLKQVQM